MKKQMLPKVFTLNSTNGPLVFHLYLSKRRSITIKYLSEENVFQVNAPNRTSINEVSNLLYEKEQKILKLKETATIKTLWTGNVYFFGKLLSSEEVTSITKSRIKIVDYDSFYRATKKYFLTYLTDKVRYYESVMNTTRTYNVSVKNMKTRWGVNSLRTIKVSFAAMLVHFSHEIIDSVIIHELVHDFIRGHGRDFYQMLTKYCPNHRLYSTKLRKKIYE